MHLRPREAVNVKEHNTTPENSHVRTLRGAGFAKLTHYITL